MNFLRFTKRNPEEPFKSLWELDKWMYAHRIEWHAEKNSAFITKTGDQAFIKRYGSVWYRLSWSGSMFDRQVYISPTSFPVGYGEPGYEAARDRITAHVDIRGLTMSDLENKIHELLQNYKELKSPRQKRDMSKINYYGGDARLVGDAALKAWRTEVERVLQEIIDGGSSTVFTTADLAGNVIDNYSVELYGISRVEQGRYIRVVLESMAKRNLIVKDTNERSPKWLSKSWKQGPRW